MQIWTQKGDWRPTGRVIGNVNFEEIEKWESRLEINEIEKKLN